jgi:hypothetical protein
MSALTSPEECWVALTGRAWARVPRRRTSCGIDFANRSSSFWRPFRGCEQRRRRCGRRSSNKRWQSTRCGQDLLAKWKIVWQRTRTSPPTTSSTVAQRSISPITAVPVARKVIGVRSLWPGTLVLGSDQRRLRGSRTTSRDRVWARSLAQRLLTAEVQLLPRAPSGVGTRKGVTRVSLAAGPAGCCPAGPRLAGRRSPYS